MATLVQEIHVVGPAPGERLVGPDHDFVLEQEVQDLVADRVCVQYIEGWCPSDLTVDADWQIAPDFASHTTEPIACDFSQWSNELTDVVFPFKIFRDCWVRIGLWNAVQTGDPAYVAETPWGQPFWIGPAA